MKTIIIVTKDFSGLGFAILAKRDAKVILAYKEKDIKPEDKESYLLVGNNIVPKIPLDSLLKQSPKLKDAYWIFDQNYLPEYADKLREKGFKVFGASKFMATLEDDRKFAIDLAKRAGFGIPEYQELKSAEEGLRFLDLNKDKAYVFKPDGADLSYLTYVPNEGDDTEANRSLYNRLKTLKEGTDSYVLQERKKGVEANFEMWVYKGKPFFAFVDLENKRKLNRDEGENTGCAFDYVFKVPVNSRAIQRTVAMYLKLPEFKDYTGFIDANVIIAENEAWFLENCMRFGYNSHPNLFHNLALDSFGNIMSDFIDGKVDTIESRFNHGFGTSLSLYLDHKQRGMPISIKDMKNFYPYEIYKDGGEYYLAGFGNDIGIYMNFDYEMEDAGEGAFNHLFYNDIINYPDRAERSDAWKTDYPNSPIKRYNALVAMGLLMDNSFEYEKGIQQLEEIKRSKIKCWSRLL